MSDPEHTAVYAAELAAFDGTDLEELQPFEIIGGLLRGVVNDSWWPAGPVDVRRARSDASSSTTRCAVDDQGASATIRLSATQMTVATAAHELAHALAGIGHGHDAVYRRAYLDVVRVITNLDTTDRRRDIHTVQLADAFAGAGLRVGERAWPAPPEAIGSAFAL
jgi:hypothetical protein